MKLCKWKDISTYRGELFGIAIISIILYHYFMLFNTTEAPNATVKLLSRVYNSAVGSVGVDMFILLSGFGIYYSLSRGGSLVSFYKKRIKRVVVPYLVIGLIYWAVVDLIIRGETVRVFLSHYTLIAFWTGHIETFWYITFITLMYIISPFVYWLACDTGRFAAGVIGSAAIVLAVYFFVPEYFDAIEIALQRLPYFLVGMRCGRLSKAEEKSREQEISSWMMIFLAVSVPIKAISGHMRFVFDRMLYGYYAVFLIVFYTTIRKAMPERWNRCFSLLRVPGTYSLELYMAHTTVKNIMSASGLQLKDPLVYLLHVVITVPLVCCIARIQKSEMYSRILK